MELTPNEKVWRTMNSVSRSTTRSKHKERARHAVRIRRTRTRVSLFGSRDAHADEPVPVAGGARFLWGVYGTMRSMSMICVHVRF